MTTATPGGRLYPFTSQFGTHGRVMLDPWAVNPLLDDALQSVPQTVAAARASNGEPPTMFESGDLPPFTASGVDPQVLLRLPFQLRHFAASEPSAAQLLALVEKFSHYDDVEGQAASPGLDAYGGRMRDWLAGRWTNPNFAGPDDEQANAANDAMFNALFGPTVEAKAATIAAVNAANPPRTGRAIR